MAEKHPYITGSNQFSMSPSQLRSIGVNIDTNCVVCGIDAFNQEEVFVDNGYIHCINCALKHRHITEKEYKEHGGML